MNTKNMTIEEAQEYIELLKNRIDFNNRLNKVVRKYRRENQLGYGEKNYFNGFRDKPTSDMIRLMRNLLSQEDWMPEKMKFDYLADTSCIFGNVYSLAVNTYILKDLHDCEKFIELHKKSENNLDEENELFSVERDLNTNRMNLYFDGIPDTEVRSIIKSNGFRWSPNFKCWTRQLTDQAEMSLKRIKRQLEIID